MTLLFLEKILLGRMTKAILAIALMFSVRGNFDAAFANNEEKKVDTKVPIESSMANYVAHSSTLWSKDRTIKHDYIVKRNGNSISLRNTRTETAEPNGKIIDTRTTEENFLIKSDGIHIVEAATNKDLGLEFPLNIPEKGKQIQLGDWEYAWSKQAVFDGVDIGPCVGRKNKSVPGTIEFQLYCQGRGLVAHRVGGIYRQAHIKGNK